MNRLDLPHGLTPERFLREYWEQKPLLMRNALNGLRAPLSPEELAGLACEPEVESRIVLENAGAYPWQVRHGPFAEHDFAGLPETHWTLLVQDVDKHLPRVARLLDPFRFLPDWRIDDIMVSFAADQGSVGPHVDDYDVFLVQTSGRRRWRIHSREVGEDEFIPGLDLRILPRFQAEQEWVLEPGDILYLPPRLAHWGIAEGACMTCSVGFRAPALRDMVRSWSEFLIEVKIPDWRYRDPELKPQESSAEITPEVMSQMETLLASSLSGDRSRLARWFGQFVTEPKENLHCEPETAPQTAAELLKDFQRRAVLTRSSYARLAFFRGHQGQDLLFANGEAHTLPAAYGGFLHPLTQERELHYGYVQEWLQSTPCLELLFRLYQEGCFVFTP